MKWPKEFFGVLDKKKLKKTEIILMKFFVSSFSLPLSQNKLVYVLYIL